MSVYAHVVISQICLRTQEFHHIPLVVGVYFHNGSSTEMRTREGGREGREREEKESNLRVGVRGRKV